MVTEAIEDVENAKEEEWSVHEKQDECRGPPERK